jgi:hypothetical protein
MHTRRTLIAGFFATLALPAVAVARPPRRAARRTVRRTSRRRVRRRMRRRVAVRTVAGRRAYVVPTAVAAGWELETDTGVVVVQEPTVVKVDGVDRDALIVVSADGTKQTILVVREDDATNSVDMPGSEIAEGDTTTPGKDWDED